MAVTELALLRVLHPSPDGTVPESLISKLTEAGSAQASFSKVPVGMYQCVEDPALIYLIGGWESVDFHMNVWVPGAKNQELLKLLGDDLGVEWLEHIDLEPRAVFSEGIASTTGEPRAVVAFGRHFVKNGSDAKGEFADVFENNRKYLEDNIGGKDRVAGGWRVDKEQQESGLEKEEFVLFTGWDSVEKHMQFSKTENFHKYAAIREYLEGADIKHGKRIVVALPVPES